MEESPDYYRLLDVPKDASGAEIKHAYLELAKQHHPDRNQGTTLLGTHFQQISKAYTVLSNPEQRAAYDQQRSAAQRGKRQHLDQNRVPPGFAATAPPKHQAPQPMQQTPAAQPPVMSPALAEPSWLMQHAEPIVWMLVSMNVTLLAVVGVLVAVVFVH